MNSQWRPSPCRLNGFHVYLLERQTGQCRRWDYEFARDASGNLLEFRNRGEALKACDALAVPEDRNHGRRKGAVAPHHESAQTMAHPGSASGVSAQPGLFDLEAA